MSSCSPVRLSSSSFARWMRISLVGASATLTACGSSGTRGNPLDASTIDGPSTNPDAPVVPHIDANLHAPDADPNAPDAHPGAPDASPPPDADPNAPDAGPFTPADHPAPPQVVDSGGAVLAHPTIVPIFFSGQDTVSGTIPVSQSQIEDALGALPGSTYWNQTTSEYGVGDVTLAPTLVLSSAAPSNLPENTLLNDLRAGFAGANPPFGTPIADAIYMFFIPKNTVFNSGGSNCCSDFYGYHDETTINGQNVPYAIVCSCDGSQDNPPVSDLNDIMVTASHEAVESATDPYFNQGVAYGQTDDNDAAWSIFTDGEVADMCEYRTDEDIAAAPATGLVQRSWSNAAASAGHDPCVPQPAGEVYFNSAPVLSDSVSIFDFNGNPWPTKGVKIAVGSSVTIPVKLWSEAPTSGDWTVAAYDYNDYVGGQANLTFTWDRTTGHNGDTLNLTIHVVSHNNNLGGELFMIDSTLGTVDSESIGAVGQ